MMSKIIQAADSVNKNVMLRLEIHWAESHSDYLTPLVSCFAQSACELELHNHKTATAQCRCYAVSPITEIYWWEKSYLGIMHKRTYFSDTV